MRITDRLHDSVVRFLAPRRSHESSSTGRRLTCARGTKIGQSPYTLKTTPINTRLSLSGNVNPDQGGDIRTFTRLQQRAGTYKPNGRFNGRFKAIPGPQQGEE